MLANLLESILPVVISDIQCAFVPSRLITNNVLVAFETVNTIRRRRRGHTGYVSIKLDMSKACDWVEWSFLECIMQTMGFHAHIVHQLMTSIRSVSYRVLLHGVPMDAIHPTLGQRQGCPLFPYLFLFFVLRCSL